MVDATDKAAVSNIANENADKVTQEQQKQSLLSDESMRKIFKPNPTHDQILLALKQSFFHHDNDKIEIQQELDSYDDRNYLIRVHRNSTEEHFLLKIHNGVESRDLVSVLKAHNNNNNNNDSAVCCSDNFYNCSPDSVIHWQNALMEYLSSKGIPAPIPQRIVQWKSTSTFTASSQQPPVFIQKFPVVSHPPDALPENPDDDLNPYQCELALQLLSWIPGRTMSSIPMLPIETLADAGQFLGRVDLELDQMLLQSNRQYRASKRFHQWDTRHTTGLRSYTKYISNPHRRCMVESIIDTFQQQIIDSGLASKFRIGINHGDFNDANILLNDNLKVCGLIDFGDSVESWRVLDIAVALAYAFLSVYGKAGRSLAAAAAMLRGFQSVYPLLDVELERLHLLIACRLACSVTLGAYSYQQNPENQYLLFHAEPAWKTLTMLWGDGDSDKRDNAAKLIRSLFDQACNLKYNSMSHDASSSINCTDLDYPDEYWLSDEGANHWNASLAAN